MQFVSVLLVLVCVGAVAEMTAREEAIQKEFGNPDTVLVCNGGGGGGLWEEFTVLIKLTEPNTRIALLFEKLGKVTRTPEQYRIEFHKLVLEGPPKRGTLTINRFTGKATIFLDGTEAFEGTCKKTEAMF